MNEVITEREIKFDGSRLFWISTSACSSKSTEGTTTSETSQPKSEQSAPLAVGSNDANVAAAPSDAAIVFSLDSLRGRVGFDWFVAGTCREVNLEVITAFKKAKAECEKETEAPFGGEYSADVIGCKVGEGEWLLFANADDCKIAYENMEANAP